MQNILEDLYQGNIRPVEKRYLKSSMYNEEILKLNELIEELSDELNEKQKERLNELIRTTSNITAIECESDFKTGIRLGAKIILEILIPSDDEIKQMNEE